MGHHLQANETLATNFEARCGRSLIKEPGRPSSGPMAIIGKGFWLHWTLPVTGAPFKEAFRGGWPTGGLNSAISACPAILSWAKMLVSHAVTCQPRHQRAKTRSFQKVLGFLNFATGSVFCSEVGRALTGKSVRRLHPPGMFQPRPWSLIWVNRYASFGWRVSVAVASLPSGASDNPRENCRFLSLSNRLSPVFCWQRKRCAMS